MINVFVMTCVALVAQHLNALIGSGDGELDSSAVVKVVERMSGTR
jgi:2-hydroxy-3-oxopropionate reductase